VTPLTSFNDIRWTDAIVINFLLTILFLVETARLYQTVNDVSDRKMISIDELTGEIKGDYYQFNGYVLYGGRLMQEFHGHFLLLFFCIYCTMLNITMRK
jgi:hypothetical protein